MEYKKDWECSKERLRALWEYELVDRCCVSVTAPRKGCCRRYAAPPESPEALERWYTDAEWILNRHVDRFQNTYFGGDAFPAIWPNFGTAGHIKYFEGCRYVLKPETVWYEASLLNWGKQSLKFNPNNAAFHKEKEILQFLTLQGKDKFFVGMPDNCGVLDALAHIRGSDNVLMDMIMDPETVKKACSEILEVLINTSVQFFDILSCNGTGTVHAWMQTWSEGRHMQVQCDLSVMISNAMYDEFVRQELECMGAWLDHMIYHFDGQEQIRHLDTLLSIEDISMIQWTPVAGQPPTSDFITVLKRIQDAGKGLILFPKKREIESIMSALSSKGLHLVITDAETEEEAKDIVKKVAQWTRA